MASWTIAWRHFRSTSGFIGCWKFRSQKFLLHQKIRREISAGVFKAIFDLRPHLVVDILNFESFVTRVTDMDATVKTPPKIKFRIFWCYVRKTEMKFSKFHTPEMGRKIKI